MVRHIIDLDDLIARGARLWKKLELYPGRGTVTWWLMLTNIAIVVLVTTGLSIAAINRLKDLANAQGLSRVRVAAGLAREDLRRYGEDAIADGAVAQRPALMTTMAKSLSQRVGLEVRLIDYRAFINSPVDDFTLVRTSGLADGRSAALRVDSQDLYVASAPVFTAKGEAVALIEVRLPVRETDTAVRSLIKQLLVSAVVLAIVAVLAGLILGRRVAGPVQALNTAAVELGQGDFSTAIPTGGTAEVVQLAHTMETMRRNLIELTGTLRRREAEAQAMLGGISHEFRTPLAAQLASIELLRAGLGSMTEQQVAELVLSLERGVMRLMRLVDNLLENVRIESGQLSIRRQSLTLAEAAEDAQALIGVLLEQRRQELKIALPPDLPSFEGDRQRLTQVFVNLISNASKYAPEGSAVRIGGVYRDGQIHAWVEDEGPGVPEQARDQIFERFNRGGGPEPAPSGLGLGLWIVKSIIDRHGGSVSYARTFANRTRFGFTLPVDRQSESA